MPDMGKHASNDRALRRARVAAWTVFISMAGTTMTFQVYHSIKVGRMPWELAGLYGVVPLLISICILEIVAEWEGAPAWAKCAAYAIMGGSMFMSAAATGAVVLHAAPPHWSLLFGLLLDAAALLSVHFLLSGPRPLSRAADAERRASRTESQNQNQSRRAASPAAARTAERKPAASSQNQAAAVTGTSAAPVPGTRGEAPAEPAAELTAAQNREPAGGEEDGRKLTMDELVALARGAVVDFADANDGKRISWQALGLELGVAKAKAGEVLKLIGKQDAAAAGPGGR